MKNYQVATVFDNIAALMEIDGDSPFKVGAYRRAAETFRSLTDSIEELAERGELRGIPGVGEAIETKTRQIIETGTCDLHERLKAKFPPTLIELLGLPGVGAKTVRTLYDTLRVSSLADLKAAASAGRVKDMPRMGAKAEQNLLESIRRLEARPPGMPIARALPLTDSLASELRRLPAVCQAWAAGPPRRFTEMAECICCVISSDRPDLALEQAAAGIHAAAGYQLLAHRAVVATDAGSVIIWADQPQFAGSALVRGTGSDAHVEALEGRARSLGLAFEGTRLTAPSGNLIETPTEEAFYSALDMQLVPPEMREDSGEIGAAIAHDLPELITLDDLKGDLHSHTDASDGIATAQTMAEAAAERGYQYLAVTDHSQSLTVARGLTQERLREQARVIEQVNRNLPTFRLLKGIEVDIKSDGSLDLPDDALAALDIVVASIHSAFNLPEKEMTGRAVRAVSSSHVHVMAHPTGRLIGARDSYPIDLDRLIDAALAGRTALEINSFLDRLDLNGPNARQARDAGVKIAISTDSHNPGTLANIANGVAVARRGWLTRSDVLNTMSLDELQDWLRSGR